MEEETNQNIEKNENFNIEIEEEEDNVNEVEEEQEDINLDVDEEAENIDEEKLNNNENENQENKEEIKERKNLITKFPIAKIKNIIKMNSDVKLCMKNVYPVLGKAVELLFEDLASKAQPIAKFNKRRKLNPEDLCKLLFYLFFNSYNRFCF